MIYVICKRNGATCCMSWEGHTQAQVTTLLTTLGATNVQFVDEATYKAALPAIV